MLPYVLRASIDAHEESRVPPNEIVLSLRNGGVVVVPSGVAAVGSAKTGTSTVGAGHTSGI